MDPHLTVASSTLLIDFKYQRLNDAGMDCLTGVAPNMIHALTRSAEGRYPRRSNTNSALRRFIGQRFQLVHAWHSHLSSTPVRYGIDIPYQEDLHRSYGSFFALLHPTTDA